ncbi:helix-turn-helix domain-containing protein [Pseudonocardia spinosispora]|uniref:helix-turn-helix domain-containing protein n=1 Tax=Pseudonocardia spinosispora TaxID=103441 RepID=UPI0005687FDF|nr:helix-turn-helix domain-containing protein [Pseudonocardia spinosispora]
MIRDDIGNRVAIEDSRDSLLTVAEIATALRLSKMTVYRMIHSGELRAILVRGSYRVRESSLREILDSVTPMKVNQYR